MRIIWFVFLAFNYIYIYFSFSFIGGGALSRLVSLFRELLLSKPLLNFVVC